MKVKEYLVYGIYDKNYPDRCRYIGLTTAGLSVRFKQHWDESRRDRADLPIVRWFRKREAKNQIEIRLLESFDTIEAMKKGEIRWIEKMRSTGQADLNITDGGESQNGRRWTSEQRKAKSMAMSGKNNPFYGKRHPDEVLERIRAAAKAWVPPPEWYQKRRELTRGERNPAATLKEWQVLEIYNYYKDNLVSIVHTAKKFNTNAGIVGRIVRGQAWKHLKLEPIKRTLSKKGENLGIKRPISWYHNKYHVNGYSRDTMPQCPECFD